jgi:predicted esterase
MNVTEKRISYTSRNTYSTLNHLSDRTKNVWFVFHGIGYLSRYFLKYFDGLSPEENFIIAPQAPSKYYLNSEYKHVGASWLTREDRQVSMENIISYLDGIYEKEAFPANCNLIVFGFSQGVSVAMRWVATRKIPCNHLVLYAGGIPDELTKNDFDFLPSSTKITAVVGDADEYLTTERLVGEKLKINSIFGDKAEQIIFPGAHEVKKELILALI